MNWCCDHYLIPNKSEPKCKAWREERKTKWPGAGFMKYKVSRALDNVNEIRCEFIICILNCKHRIEFKCKCALVQYGRSETSGGWTVWLSLSLQFSNRTPVRIYMVKWAAPSCSIERLIKSSEWMSATSNRQQHTQHNINRPTSANKNNNASYRFIEHHHYHIQYFTLHMRKNEFDAWFVCRYKWE